MRCGRGEDASQGSQTITPPAIPSTTNKNVLRAAESLPTIPRFLHLLSHAKSLIGSYGPYTTLPNTMVFVRADVTRDTSSSQDASPAVLALSLAAAQDCKEYAQPQSLASQDLIFLEHLWMSTLAVLEELLETNKLDIETVSWGIVGLCAGYMVKVQDQDFQSYKTRLSNALRLMPSLDWPGQGSQWDSYRGYMSSTGTTVRVLATARSEIHACTIMLLQRFANEEWKKIRWYHGIAVAERWIGALRGCEMENYKVEDNKSA
ncbi:hypothetical protein IAQ61_010928 [Plenodomus lingam]|uniref:uncharacterized protein n=1 Tax=Leptosphaeria maculans TaxID=5022 RepID=UPI003319EA29|nr:hypothetical protein IAQ61_010928 [Plenodomus lingam]